MTFRVPNWSNFQHYKQRTPPWIKLHRQILDNEEFAILPVASRALAPLVWLLASEGETGGELPTLKKMAWRLRMSESDLCEALEPLVSAGFVEDADGLLAIDKHQPIPRQRREEVEIEAEKNPPPAREETEAVDAETAALSSALTEALKRASEITGLSGMEILADAKVRGKAAPITNPGGCTVASRKLWHITIDRVGGFVAAWQSDRRGKAAKRVAVPAFDRGGEHEVTEADIAWDPRLGPDPRLAAPDPMAPKRPDLTLTVAPGSCPECGSPIRHSIEAGETILRCAGEFAPCDWAAVWAEVRVA